MEMEVNEILLYLQLCIHVAVQHCIHVAVFYGLSLWVENAVLRAITRLLQEYESRKFLSPFFSFLFENIQ